MNRLQTEKFKQALNKVFENDEGRWARDKRIKAEEAAKQAEEQRKAKEQQDRVRQWNSQGFESDADRAKKGLPPAESTPSPQAPNPKLSPSGSYLETNPKFDFRKAGAELDAKDAAERARKEAADREWTRQQDAKAKAEEAAEAKKPTILDRISSLIKTGISRLLPSSTSPSTRTGSPSTQTGSSSATTRTTTTSSSSIKYTVGDGIETDETHTRALDPSRQEEVDAIKRLRDSMKGGAAGGAGRSGMPSTSTPAPGTYAPAGTSDAASDV